MEVPLGRLQAAKLSQPVTAWIVSATLTNQDTYFYKMNCVSFLYEMKHCKLCNPLSVHALLSSP
jgi:hypothetical protein